MQFLIKTGIRTDAAIDLSSQILKACKGFLLSINLVNTQEKWTLLLSFRNLPKSDSPEYKPEMKSVFVIESAKIVHDFQIMNHFPVAFAEIEPDLLSEILACVDRIQDDNLRKN